MQEQPQNEFEKAAAEPPRGGLVQELWGFLAQNKKWWLLPILAVFAVLSFLMVLVGGSSVLPAIYALF